MIKTPECDKIVAVREKSLELGSFVDWLGANGFAICSSEETPGYPKEQWVSIRQSYEQLFGDYFGIDNKKAEEERQALLAEIR